MEKEGIKLIGQVEDVARDISYHADHLSSLPSGISKETHYHLPAGIRTPSTRCSTPQKRWPPTQIRRSSTGMRLGRHCRC
jgi:hypothetical protein